MTAPLEVISGVALAPDLEPTGPRPMIPVLDAEPGRADELRRLVTELTEHVRREPGCLALIPYQQHSVAGRFYLYEMYRDLDAFRTISPLSRSSTSPPAFRRCALPTPPRHSSSSTRSR